MAPGGKIWHQEGKYGNRRGNMAPGGGNMAPRGEIWHQEGETHH